MEGTRLQVAVAGKTAMTTVHMDQEGREYEHSVYVSCKMVCSDDQNKATADFQKLENLDLECGQISQQQQTSETNISQVCQEKCRVEGTGLQVAVAEKISTASVHMYQEGSEYQHPVDISCELMSSDGRKIEYQVSFQPQNGGRHQLHKPIAMARSPYPSLTIPKPNTTNRLNKPYGLSVNSSGDIIISEWGSNCISILSKDGEKVRTFGSDQLKWPYDVAVTDAGDILVCDFSNNCIQLFSFEGKLLKRVGTMGSGQLQFNSPTYVAIHPHSKKIFVTDSSNRVQVLNYDLSYYASFGFDLIYSYGIAFDPSGNKVYVADSGSSVKVYTSDGKDDRKPIQQLCKDDSEHVMRWPWGVAVDSTGVVYVTETGNHCVSMFNKDGTYIHLAQKGRGKEIFILQLI